MDVTKLVENHRTSSSSTYILVLVEVVPIGTCTRALVRSRVENETIRARGAIVLRRSCTSAAQSVAGKALLRMLIETTRACCEAISIQQ